MWAMMALEAFYIIRKLTSTAWMVSTKSFFFLARFTREERDVAA